MTTPNANLFAALRAAFPQDLDRIAVETDNGLHYSWRDLERASAMIANLLAALKLGEGARIAVQVEKSVEALLLYLATLRAGYVFLPLNTAYQSAEIEYFIGNAEPEVVVCSSANAPWVGPIAQAAGVRHVFTLNDDRSGTLLELAAQCSDRHTRPNGATTTWPPSSTPAAPPAAARVRCSPTATCARTPKCSRATGAGPRATC